MNGTSHSLPHSEQTVCVSAQGFSLHADTRCGTPSNVCAATLRVGGQVGDAAALCLAALDQADPGSSYIASDGTPKRWSDIFQYAAAQWNIPIPEPTIPKDLGKRLSPQKFLNELNYTLRHPNLYEELNKIESEGEGTI